MDGARRHPMMADTVKSYTSTNKDIIPRVIKHMSPLLQATETRSALERMLSENLSASLRTIDAKVRASVSGMQALWAGFILEHPAIKNGRREKNDVITAHLLERACAPTLPERFEDPREAVYVLSRVLWIVFGPDKKKMGLHEKLTRLQSEPAKDMAHLNNYFSVDDKALIAESLDHLRMPTADKQRALRARFDANRTGGGFIADDPVSSSKLLEGIDALDRSRIVAVMARTLGLELPRVERREAGWVERNRSSKSTGCPFHGR